MAARQLDNRGKLTIGIIAGLLLIGALHVMVFQSNQKKLEEAQRQFRESVSKVGNIRRGNQPELDKYEQVTKSIAHTFTTMTGSLNVDSPDFLQMWVNPDPAKAAEVIAKRDNYFRELVKTLLEKRSGKVRLPFLGVNYPQAPLQIMGWQIPDTLPPEFEKQPAKISDALERLKDIRKLLAAYSTEDVEAEKGRQAKLLEYQTELAKFGVHGDLLRFLTDQCQMGEFIPLVNLVAVSELIMAKKPKDYAISLTAAPGARTESLEDLIFTVPILRPGAQLVEDMNVSYPAETPKMVVACKQLETLNDLIDIAAKNDVAMILRVRFFDGWMFNGNVLSSADFYKPGSTLTADLLCDYFRLPSGLPAPATPQEGALNALSANPAEGGAESKPNANNTVGVVIPIDLTFVADNTHTVQYLYEIAHSPRMYEINSLNFQINENKPGEKLMAVNTVVLAYAWVKDVSGVREERPAGRARGGGANAEDRATSGPAERPGGRRAP